MSLRTVALAMLAVAMHVSLTLAQGTRNSSLWQDPRSDRVPSTPVGPFAMNTPPATPESGTIVSPATGNAPNLAGASWIYVPPASPRTLRLHDVISIRVDEVARMTAEGRVAQRKNALSTWVLKDWLELDGFGVRKAPQTAGDPAINGEANQQFRATSDLLTRETLAFNIAAEIADIRPNGNIVLEGHKAITINDNRWEISVSGMCQTKDIGPDNVVLSKDIIDLKIDKREAGQARDGYRRGWFTEWYNRLQPF